VTIVPVFEAATVLDTWARSGATFYMALPTFIASWLRHSNVKGSKQYAYMGRLKPELTFWIGEESAECKDNR
jgi:hypothetical protein